MIGRLRQLLKKFLQFLLSVSSGLGLNSGLFTCRSAPGPCCSLGPIGSEGMGPKFSFERFSQDESVDRSLSIWFAKAADGYKFGHLERTLEVAELVAISGL